MALRFLIGMVGAGKTLYAMKLITQELVEGERVVFTNIDIDRPAYNEFLQENYPNGRYADLHERLIELDDFKTTPEFYRWRPQGYRVSLRKLGHREVPDYSKCYRIETDPETGETKESGDPVAACELPNVLYVIDELHQFFSARDWMKTGQQVHSYVTQHRKLGDQVLVTTQYPDQVDKGFRQLCNSCVVLENKAKEKICWLFRKPAYFIKSEYPGMPRRDMPRDSFSMFKIPLGLAECYRTESGVGIKGKNADKGERAKGLSPKLLGIGLVGLCVLMLLGWQLGKGYFVGKARSVTQSVYSSGEETVKIEAKVTRTNSNQITGLVVRQRKSEGVEVGSHAAADESVQTPWEYCLGYYGRPGFITAYMDDGSRVNSQSGRISQVGRGFLVIDGVRYPVRREKIDSRR